MSDVLIERKARATGTLVQLVDRGPSSEHGDWRWETICVEHGGVASHESRKLAEAWLSHPDEWCEDCMYGEGTLAGEAVEWSEDVFDDEYVPPADHDGAQPQKEATMAATTKKGLTARESIEAAFTAGSEKRLKTAQIIERVEANKDSSIGAGTIRTQLQLQASKKAEGYVKRVAPGTWQLQEPKVKAEAKTEEPKVEEASGDAEVTPDPKPSRRRGRKQEEPVAA